MNNISNACLVAVALLALLLTACERKPAERAPEAKPSSPAPTTATDELVVYCSADAAYFQPVLDAFTARTGIKVRPLFDTEATKTFGLVQRLLSEKDQPRADVFVSSEALGMIRLDRAGVLAPHTCAAAEGAFAKVGGWPKALRSSNATWYGFARRARVLVYNTKFVQPAEVPTRLADLTKPRWKGRVAMARPQFGTTRTHIAALRLAHTPDAFESWLAALRANDLRLYDGNSSVVRAVASGEAHIGLTDNDDVHAGLANNWPIDMKLVGNQLQAETHDRAPTSDPLARAIVLPYPENTLQIPHTVAIIKGTTRADLAARFVEFVLSSAADDILARGDAKTYPTVSAAFQDPASALINNAAPPSTLPVLQMLDISQEQIADQAEEALATFERMIEGK